MYKILVCDDDREIVEAIEIYLSQEGYQILKAYDGIEALEILEKEEVNLLIIDVMMPRLDGIRATLRSARRTVCQSLSCLRSQKIPIRFLDSISVRMIM